MTFLVAFMRVCDECRRIRDQLQVVLPMFGWRAFVVYALLFSHLAFLPLSIYAQTFNPVFHNYTVNDGLPSLETYDVTQDNLGYIWFATENGLCRYDGYKFETFTVEDGLPEDCVLGFDMKSDSSVWFFTLGCKLGYIKDGCIAAHPANKALASITQPALPLSITQLAADSLMLGTTHGGYVVTRAGDIQVEELKTYKYNPRRFDNGVFIGSNNYSYGEEYFLVSQDGHQHLIEESDVFYNVYACASDSAMLSAFGPHVLYSRNDTSYLRQDVLGEWATCAVEYKGYYWVGLRDGGGVKYFRADRPTEPLKNLLEGVAVSNVFEDRAGGMWFTTLNKGVYYAPMLETSTGVYSDSGNRATTSISNREGKIVVGYENGSIGTNDLSLGNQFFQSICPRPISVFSKSKHDTILYIGVDSLFVSSLCPDGFEFVPGRPIAHFRNSFVCQINKGIGIWSDSVPRKIGWNKRLSMSRAYDALSSTPTRLLVATNDGLVALDSNLHINESFGSQFPQVRMNCLSKLRENILIGSHSEGLFILNSNQQLRQLYHEALSQVTVHDLACTSDTVWVATNMGIKVFLFKNNDLQFLQNLNESAGLPTNQVKQLLVTDNFVYAGSTLGIAAIRKDVVFQRRTDVICSVTKVLVNMEEQPEFSVLSDLSYDQNTIQVFVEALDFTTLGKQHFRYKLYGWHDQWLYSDSRSLQFKLPPGRYKLLIQTRTGTDIWQDVYSLIPINIAPQFWKTPWFWCLMILAFILSVYAAFRVRLLTYNRDILSDLMVNVLHKIKGKPVPFLMLKSARTGSETKVVLHEVLFVKSARDYLEVHSVNQQLLVRKTLKSMQLDLSDCQYIQRVHRSYMVNLDRVDEFRLSEVKIGQTEIPVGRQYKDVIKRYRSRLTKEAIN